MRGVSMFYIMKKYLPTKKPPLLSKAGGSFFTLHMKKQFQFEADSLQTRSTSAVYFSKFLPGAALPWMLPSPFYPSRLFVEEKRGFQDPLFPPDITHSSLANSSLNSRTVSIFVRHPGQKM
jgi:hypothetical protein